MFGVMIEVEQLQRRIAELEAERQQAEADKQRLEQENQKLREELAAKELELKLLLKRLYGPKSERFVEGEGQLHLDFGDADQVDDALEGVKQAEMEQETTVEGYTRRRAPRRETFPDGLPREVVIIDLSDEEKEGLECIGYDKTETLVYVPGKLYIRETRYPKYVDPSDADRGVPQAEREAGLVEGNRYDTSVAAQVVTAKYGYHLPIYRQQDIFAGCGWVPSRSTLLNLLVSVATLIRPLIEFFANRVRSDRVVATDDTGVRLLLPKTIPKVDPDDPKSGRVHEVLSEAAAAGTKSILAKMWAYRGVTVPLNVFDFTVSRHRDGPDLFLIDQGYRGILLGDCYGANTGIITRSCGEIVHAACSSHARRKILDASDNHQEHAKQFIRMFRELSDIEDRGRAMSVQERLELRQRESVPIWNRMRWYIDTQMSNVLPKESMALAVNYLNNQWEALTLYLTDGMIPMDNNEVEQLMKLIALGRKNWLFIGSVPAGYRAADLLTLVSSAVRNDLDVLLYVQGVLDALLAGEENYELLLPDVWATDHPDHVRHYRVNERGQRELRKRAARERRREARLFGLRS